MKNRFPSLESLKKKHPEHAPFYTQSWVYAGLTALYSQQDRFAELEFDSFDSDLIIVDYKWSDNNNYWSNYCGQVFEGHVDYWAQQPIPKNSVLISGHEHFSKTAGYTSLGFDYWDIMTYHEFHNATTYYEINRDSVQKAEHDAIIPVGNPRAHRLTFLEVLNEIKQDLTIITDDRQTTLDTDLRFSTMGIEVYLNKVGLKKYQPYTPIPSFYDTNTQRSLDHLPHKRMHSTARVNVILETTTYDTNSPYLTEKTFKVLSQHRPFILFGDTNSLKKLQQQGFLTFEKYCDESYDNIADPVAKSHRAVEALKQLVKSCKKYPDEIDRICRHNQELFFKQQRHADNLAAFGRKILKIIEQD